MNKSDLMISMLSRLIIGFAMIALIGCTSVITHMNTNYAKISPDEALRRISELSLVYGVSQPNRMNTFAYAKIVSVDQAGFNFIRSGTFITGSKSTPAIVGGRNGTEIRTYYRTESPNIRVNFQDIVGLQIGYFELTGEGPQIQLVWRYAPPFLLLTPHGMGNPAKLKEYAAAFLTLCPNIP